MSRNSPSPANSYSLDRTGGDNRRQIPVQLQRHGWLAVSFLLLAWILVTISVWMTNQEETMSFLVLLPGLAIALRISHVLLLSLGKNYGNSRRKEIYATLGAANWITTLRAVLVIGLACLLPLCLELGTHNRGVLGWGAGVLYLLVGLADILDGFVARKQQRITELGQKLDIETDAAGLLAASMVGVALGGLPLLYLVVAFLYYFFIFGLWLRKRQELPVTGLIQRPYGRIIAGCQMGLVALVLFPVFAPVYTKLGALIFMIPFLLGFLRDWLVISCRVQTDDTQQCRLDVLCGRTLKSGVALAARSLFICCGLIILFAEQSPPMHLAWLIGYIISWIMVMVGFLGRSGAIIMMVLLGLSASPLGISIVGLVGFISATVLVLVGNGPLSLWAPEEDFIYRR
jgi:CDP-diacylglycerol--glycerol-3-phosphate 3-phosphatidyltransferase